MCAQNQADPLLDGCIIRLTGPRGGWTRPQRVSYVQSTSPFLGEAPGTDRRVLPCAGVPTQHRWAGAGDPRFWSPQNDLGVKPPRWPGELPRPNPTADPAGVGEGSSCCVAFVRPKLARPPIDGNLAPLAATSGFQAPPAPPRSRYPADALEPLADGPLPRRTSGNPFPVFRLHASVAPRLEPKHFPCPCPVWEFNG